VGKRGIQCKKGKKTALVVKGLGFSGRKEERRNTLSTKLD